MPADETNCIPDDLIFARQEKRHSYDTITQITLRRIIFSSWEEEGRREFRVVSVVVVPWNIDRNLVYSLFSIFLFPSLMKRVKKPSKIVVK